MKPVGLNTSIRIAAICCIVVFFCTHLRGQKAKETIDSLETVLKTKQLTPIEKLTIYSKLETAYINIDVNKSVTYCREGIPIAIAANEPRFLGGYYCGLGIYYGGRLEYDSAFFYMNLTLETAQKIKNNPEAKDDMEARVYGTMGNLNNYRGFYDEAVRYYLKAMEIYEKYNYRKSLFSVLVNIGGIYQNLENYDQTERYFSKALEIAEMSKDSASIAFAFYGLSSVSIHNKAYDQALEYLSTADSIYKQAGFDSPRIDVLLALSDLYVTGYKDYDLALTFANEALDIVNEREAFYETANALSHIANANYHKGMYSLSESIAFKALEADSSDLEVNSYLFSIIAKSNIMQGNRMKALEYLDRYAKIITEMGTKNYQSSLSEMEIKYETEKKELKILSLEKEKELYRWLDVAGSVVVLLLIAILFVRQRMVKQKVAQLEQEKQLVATQAVLDGETAERARLARDLHDGLGGMLSIVKLNINDMKHGASLEHTDVSRFDKALKMLDDSISELRRVAHNMMPDSLSRYGLKVALSDFCDSITGTEFHYFGSGDRFDPKLEVMIYRTVHELVNNVLKHAGAMKIIVQVVQEDNRISITVQDDGCGFDTTASTNGHGLQNIRNRMESYNGRMDISSKPGEGTETNVEFKLPEK